MKSHYSYWSVIRAESVSSTILSQHLPRHDEVDVLIDSRWFKFVQQNQLFLIFASVLASSEKIV